MAGEFEVYKSVAVGGKSGRQTKQETREQVIARNSFPGPDQNRYIDKFLAEQKKKMKPDCKEIEQQLSESRREFWAADATINNLELKLSEMAAQLTNAENKCRELAAENEAIKFYLRNGPVIRKGGELVAAHQFAPETPATDAFLAEVRAHDLNAFIRHHSAELDAHIKNGGEQFDEKSVRIRDIIASARLFREQIRKEAAQ